MSPRQAPVINHDLNIFKPKSILVISSPALFQYALFIGIEVHELQRRTDQYTVPIYIV